MTDSTVNTISHSREKIGLIVAAMILTLLATYYSIGAISLPHNAGPDEGDSRAAILFYLEHKRMAVFPQDEDLVKWSSYGATRTMRPPLPYFVGAGFAWLSQSINDIEVQVRFGATAGILLMLACAWGAGFILGIRASALNVALVFAGLWPQIAFTAMYCNDDAVTWGICGLIALTLALLLRHGLRREVFWLIAAVGGLVAISKFSAWPWAMILILSMIVATYRDATALKSVKNWLIALSLFLVFGGWWFIYNMYHYGISDPFQLNMMAEMAKEISDSDKEASGLFQRHGKTMLDTFQYKFFWENTYFNTIGNVGWLNARMGSLVYYLYGIVLSAILAFGVYQILARRELAQWTLWAILGTTVSTLMYVWFNTYHDVQIQGRYLLPSVPFWTVMLAGLLMFLIQRLSVVSQRWCAASTIVLVTAINFDAVNRYAVPHFWQDYFTVRWGREFRLHFDSKFFIERMENVRYEFTEDGWKLIKTGPDPKFYLRPDICLFFGNNVQVVFNVDTAVKDDFVLYIDQGYGFNEVHKLHMRYAPNQETLSGIMPITDCRAIRIDPFEKADEIIVRSLDFKPFSIRNPQ